MDFAAGEDAKPRELVTRIQFMNFASIHTTLLVLGYPSWLMKMYTHSLYYLAANPEYAEPLREEIEAAIKEYGWTKHAVMKMRKLDSFIKEALRLNPLGYGVPTRV